MKNAIYNKWIPLTLAAALITGSVTGCSGESSSTEASSSPETSQDEGALGSSNSVKASRNQWGIKEWVFSFAKGGSVDGYAINVKGLTKDGTAAFKARLNVRADGLVVTTKSGWIAADPTTMALQQSTPPMSDDDKAKLALLREDTKGYANGEIPYEECSSAMIQAIILTAAAVGIGILTLMTAGAASPVLAAVAVALCADVRTVYACLHPAQN